MKKTLFISTIIILGFTQCRKDPKLPYCEEFPENCVEIMTVKDHFYFDVGTYWVYEEENSGKLDSQWVSQAFTRSNVCWFEYRIRSSIMSHYFNISTVLLAHAIDSGLVRKDKKSILISRSKTKAGGFIGNSYIARFYYHVGDSVNNFGGGGYGSNTYYSQLKVNLIYKNYKGFNNVIQMSDKFNIAEHSQPTIHFYADGVGLIRKELIDSNQVWNLIRYNIVK